MGVVYIKSPSENSIIGLWHATESIEILFASLNLSESDIEIFHSKKSDTRRIEWLAIRNLLDAMLPNPDKIFYDDYGIPYLESGMYKISMSHSGEYVCIYLDKIKSVGIDVQKFKKTIKAGADFFLNKQELTWVDTDNNALMHIIWSAKESIYKYAGDRDLDMKRNITTSPFESNQNGKIGVTISGQNRKEQVLITYELFQDYVLTKTS